MRPKIVISVVAFSILLFLGLSWLRIPPPANLAPVEIEQAGLEGNSVGRATNSSLNAVRETQFSPPGANAVPAPEPTLADRLPPSSAQQNLQPPVESDAEKHASFVEERVSRLMELATDDDPNSLDQILSELSNPDLEIRKAALEAVKQFGSTNAIPKLNELSSRAEDPSEKLAVAEALEFLTTPSLTAVPPAPGSRKTLTPTIIKPTKWNSRPPLSENRLPSS